ncbi:hypothetical protein Taro_024011 [Colocasia esculenta]|uniref:DUF4228 domain-containing protein n=1 Tax=Colocasia esculenta TaxID=4460 RepID=A0A843UZ29_COLES|nr:hypothetical protein [Colocasia esculenta]
MGIKSLRLCFQVMGSSDLCDHPDPPASRAAAGAKAPALCIRLIRADGRVEVYHRKVRAAELMKEHPSHLVCRSDAFTIGQRIPALAEGDQLQPGHAYFLLPLHFFQSVLSFVTLASSFARAAAAAAAASNGSASPLLQRPFEVHKTPSGKLQIRVSDDFIRRIQEAQEAGDGGGGAGQGSGGGGRVCTTVALEKDYWQLVVGCRERQWKPKLETITESERKRGKLSAVGGAAGALDSIRRRSKKSYPHKVEPRGRDQLQQQAQLLQEQQQQKKQKKQKQKAANLTKHKNSPPSRKNKGEKEARSLSSLEGERKIRKNKTD